MNNWLVSGDGIVVKDPVMNEVSDKGGFCKFTLRQSRPTRKDEAGKMQYETDFIDCEIWVGKDYAGNLARESILPILTDKAIVSFNTGRLQINVWEAQDGSKRRSPKIVFRSLFDLTVQKSESSGPVELDSDEESPF